MSPGQPVPAMEASPAAILGPDLSLGLLFKSPPGEITLPAM